MKKTIIAVALGSFLLACAAYAKEAAADPFAGIPYKSASWKAKTAIESDKDNVNFEQTVYVKNKKMRMEGQFLNRATNEKENQVTIIDGNTMYSVNPDKKQGMKYSLDSKAIPGDTASAASKCRNSAKKTGSEKVNGVKCDKYEYTCKLGDGSMKVVEFRNDKGFAIKTVTDAGGSVTTTIVSDLKLNPSIPDSKFVPDKGIKFMDMENMMGGMKDALKKAGSAAKKKKGGDDDDAEAAQKMMKEMMKGMMGE
jgi:outer membrane lipoprotein-sorting protein